MWWVGALMVAFLSLGLSFDGRERDMEMRFNLTHAKTGKHAVKEAIAFMLDQQDQVNSPKLRGSQESHVSGGTCRVTVAAIQNEGMFQYLGDVAPHTKIVGHDVSAITWLRRARSWSDSANPMFQPYISGVGHFDLQVKEFAKCRNHLSSLPLPSI